MAVGATSVEVITGNTENEESFGALFGGQETFTVGIKDSASSTPLRAVGYHEKYYNPNNAPDAQADDASPAGQFGFPLVQGLVWQPSGAKLLLNLGRAPVLCIWFNHARLR